ncbi:DNA-binding response regulator, OmpR family, contains REC and winged-helix (wHTH) domain [Caloranaerobacter azorensis DSM 13643]|uniref:DNA-binding response regulator, OmpR family, contains REC and winged-helix (WHTH) domain n=1 Tax=Caloranaerobacter azorensis DSM 13643 TaxID=1121264 RepID=A0A1M5UP42_9FIRM|nr:response regulator transcription factor [Caloranaerobacter azorensis]SHH64754.1 DNA-binding response regulator, OmpR family, contains REC and winged-helix (wHTH) domain [Caloranaerobacter azorensis DSM 13643]
MESILLIEDDTTLAMGIEYSLKDEGMEVEVKYNIKDGYSAFKEKDFDLILLDVILPDGTGYDLCKKIRKESNIPIIFLTACDDEVNVIMGLDIGGDDYVTKPFRVKELISRIRATIRRNKMNNNRIRQEDTISFGSIVINIRENRVIKDDREIILTPIEYKLLLALAQNPNRVLTRTQILEKIWDLSGHFIDDNTLSVHIRRLREKIEDFPANPKYIKTVRGVGYKLSCKD